MPSPKETDGVNSSLKGKSKRTKQPVKSSEASLESFDESVIDPSDVKRDLRFRNEFLKHKAKTGETLKDFAERADVCTYWNLSQLYVGLRPLSIKKAMKIAKAMGTTVDKFVDKDVLDLIVDSYEAMYPNLTSVTTRCSRINIYSAENANDAALGKKETPSCGETYTDYNASRKLVALLVDSDEMSPRLKQKDLVIVDTEAKPQPSDIVLVHIPNHTRSVFREYIVQELDSEGNDIYELKPVDSRFPKFTASIKGIKILGVVIEKRSLRN